MIGIIGEVVSYLKEAKDYPETSFIYRDYAGGDGMSYFLKLIKKDIKSIIITKISDDFQGEIHENLLVKQYGVDYDDLNYSSLPSSVKIDDSLYIRSTAPTALECEDITRLIEKHSIDRVIISSIFLSLSPLREEVLKAIIKEKDKLKVVIIDGSDPERILLLEDFKDSLERLVKEGINLLVSGDSINIDGVKRVSRDCIIDALIEDQ